ncbi:hypothetical protein PINS_up011465 [Pythium insidiosum]|nr:hypothetical protein PINS_up011465 [Pythium insidiosum]
MGMSWSRWIGATASRDDAVISEREVQMLCEDGDLLLAREQISHAQLGVAIDACVARDISLMQRGDFPTRRLTTLPTSCALFVRHSGALHVLEIDVDGMRLAPFASRIAGRLDLSRRHRYAVRRLQHVRDERSVSFFRQLSFELATVLPLEWRHLRDPHARPDVATDSAAAPVNGHTRLPSVHALETLRATLSAVPLVDGVLRRTLQLVARSLELKSSSSSTADDATKAATGDASPPADPTPPWREQPTRRVSALESFLAREENTLKVDATAYLTTALVVAIYERLGVVALAETERLGAAPTDLELLPSSLWSREEPTERQIRFEPPDALGREMALD